MADIPAMTPAEMQVTKEYLGLNTKWMARRLVLDERRLRRMEAGSEEIPQFIVTFLDDVYAETKQLVEDMTAEYRRKVKGSDGYGVITMKTYRTDGAYAAAGGYYPSSWHRRVSGRVQAAVPGLVLIN
jgi:hypothetical protein